MKYKKAIMNSQKELFLKKISSLYVIVRAKRGPSKDTEIPLKLDEEIAFLAAAIIGDGHLRKEKKQINFESTNDRIIESIKKICYRLFKRRFNSYKRKKRPSQKESFQLSIDSKAIYNLLRDVFEIPSGKKSHKVKVPYYISNNKNKSIRSAFLIGIMVTEGGNRKRGFGLSTASVNLRDGLIPLFEDLGIKVAIDKWIYKKYNKEYYGLCFRKESLITLLEMCKSHQIKEVLKDCPNLSIAKV